MNHPQTREPGVNRNLPFLSCDGQGVNRPQTREPGVNRKLPFLSCDGRGVNQPQTREPGVGEYHPMTMPELLRWFRFLSARLRHVRIINGDWTRVVTSGASKTLPVSLGAGPAGIFLDPPYSGDIRAKDIYAHEGHDIAADVLTWCQACGDDPQLRIVLAGFDGEHNVLESAGWTVVEWFRDGFLRGGMANTGGADNHRQHAERLWLSPHCLVAPVIPRAEQMILL